MKLLSKALPLSVLTLAAVASVEPAQAFRQHHNAAFFSEDKTSKPEKTPKGAYSDYELFYYMAPRGPEDRLSPEVISAFDIQSSVARSSAIPSSPPAPKPRLSGTVERVSALAIQARNSDLREGQIFWEMEVGTTRGQPQLTSILGLTRAEVLEFLNLLKQEWSQHEFIVSLENNFFYFSVPGEQGGQQGPTVFLRERVQGGFDERQIVFDSIQRSFRDRALEYFSNGDYVNSGRLQLQALRALQKSAMNSRVILQNLVNIYRKQFKADGPRTGQRPEPEYRFEISTRSAYFRTSAFSLREDVLAELINDIQRTLLIAVAERRPTLSRLDYSLALIRDDLEEADFVTASENKNDRRVVAPPSVSGIRILIEKGELETAGLQLQQLHGLTTAQTPENELDQLNDLQMELVIASSVQVAIPESAPAVGSEDSEDTKIVSADTKTDVTKVKVNLNEAKTDAPEFKVNSTALNRNTVAFPVLPSIGQLTPRTAPAASSRTSH